MEASTPSHRIRFGKFEVDPESGELFKDGRRVRLQGQPIQILLMLLQKPGHLVTREELQQRLWPKDTFVDFDYGLNAAIKRLRESLGDSADEPLYVETLPRRGYRFIFSVEGNPAAMLHPAQAPSPSLILRLWHAMTQSPASPAKAEGPVLPPVQIDAPAVETTPAPEEASEGRGGEPHLPVGDSLQIEASPVLERGTGIMEQPLAAGRRLGSYEIISLLGTGGMGEVYLARDLRLERVVALKILSAELTRDPDRLERFLREARTASALNHPHIVTVYDVGQAEGLQFLAMEYVEGQTLAERIGMGRLQMSEAIDIGIQICEALEAAHQKGVIHRDIKPANVMVTAKGWVKVLDFGLAKQVESAQTNRRKFKQTTPGLVIGTVEYMSPEQVLGHELDSRTDIFSLGTVLYELATGHSAFAGETVTEIMDRILHAQPEAPARFNQKLSPELERIIGKCLEKERENRYQSARELAMDLRPLIIPGADKVAEVPGEGSKRWKVLVPAAVTLVAAAIWGTMYFRSRQTATRLTDKDTIVLSDFDNKTADPVFDDTLKQGLSIQLEQSPFLALVSEGKVNDILKLMGRPAGERLTPEVTREVCQRTGSTAMLTGSIAGLGSQYVIGLKAVNCSSGDVLDEVQERAASKEAVLKALDAAAVSIRRKLGESLSSVEKYATPLQEATTPSLEALKAFSLGVKAYHAKGSTASLPFYKRAVDLDPNFAMAYANISAACTDLNEVGRSAENARKAYELREKVSERERLNIEGKYYLYATGELEKAMQTFELWQHTYPRDWLPYLCQVEPADFLGNREKALEKAIEALRLEPNSLAGYINLGFAFTTFNRLDEAEAVYKQMEERKLESELLLHQRYFLAFLKGDAAQMAQLVSAAMGKPGAEDLLLATQADTEGWYGKLKNAQELTRRAMDSAQRKDAKETAASYQAAAALREVESGNRKQARAEATAAVRLAPNRVVRAMAALALARAGDMAGAEQLATELEKTFPLDTQVQRYWLPMIRAGVALERKDPNRAIELLKVASTIELAVTANLAIFLGPAYLRGEAFLMLHDGIRAAGEFQKFINRRGLVLNFPWGALARLGLARAYAMQGDTVKARAAYQDFLTLWKDADPHVPILIAAKSEYSKLQ